ncbi:TetR/AcrR family transcriptional regulator [Mycetocola tolaasinivorans]|uniref:TetR/AcrR family transcriptional regulator n=1 Tax=Mycetocola tolaasinivorans TaxID=76635 RepID=A0A3L7A4E0_9MICO|nr:TetR/AcrR family transcriptional regulator [Mycetocola tolaasinivorans]RLP74152.1 TetR/AcrR family transcriptional regulator [Mycetocola tolaasinivorans]
MTTEKIADRIVATADRLYYERGFTAVGMAELRDAAGVSLRRLYMEFPAKDAIVRAVLEKRHREWSESVEARMAEVDTPRDRLLAVYDYLADWFCDHDFRGCGFINAFGELGGEDPEVRRIVREHKESFQRRLAEITTALGAPPLLAAQLALLAEGAQTTAAIAETAEAAGQARAAAEVLIDHALGV